MTKHETHKTDVLVIGAGPGGYAAAFHAAHKGLSVTLVNAEPRPGGVCLLRGCIPSKALLHVARLLNEADEATEWGIELGRPKIDLDKLRAFKDGVIDRLTGGIAQLAKTRKVRLIRARAMFRNSNAVDLTPLEGRSGGHVPAGVEFDRCILAAGSSAAVPGPLQVGDPRVMTSRGALDLPDIPNRLLVIGGGYIGLEIGSVYRALGSRVTVVEMTGGLLPGADRDLVRPLQQRLERQFEAIHLHTLVEGLKPRKDSIAVRMKGRHAPSEARFDRVLIATGRHPNSDTLGLEHTKVRVGEDGFVRVDAARRTDDPAIWCIGDLSGQPMLAHKAAHEARVAAESVAGEKTAFEPAAIPAVVFTDPEIAWAGLTETDANEQGIEVRVARFPWAASGRAATLGRTEGLTKLLVDPATERVLGVGITGVGAGDMIAEGAHAVEMAALARDVAETIHPHPTLSETIMEAAEAFYGFSTHMSVPRRK